jgi:uncharacterized membrane protein
MKKMFLMLAVMLAGITNYAQLDSSFIKKTDQSLSTQYFQKSHRHGKTALILVGTGVAATAIAYAIFPRNYDIFGENSGGTQTAAVASTFLFITGATLMICSIPHAIISGISRHKANVLLRTEKVSLSPKLTLPGYQVNAGIIITI